MNADLDIVSAGMVTAVGLDTPSSCAAMRARLDGFQETRFLGAAGEWLIGAPVPLPRNWMGAKRLAHMAAAAIVEAFEGMPEARGRTALVLCLAEEDRPGRLAPDSRHLLAQIEQITEIAGPTASRVVAYGRPSGHVALDAARRLLASNAAPFVIIVGVDSYLTSQTINHYLARQRLLTPRNSNGFIPGEAAAAILCARRGGTMHLTGLGLAREKAHIYNEMDIPFRGEAMATAYKEAFAGSGRLHSDITLKIGDLIGEAYWFQQSALAMLRTQREHSEVRPIWALGASLGNIGAAAVPVMLGWALSAIQRGYAPSGPILIEASGDDGACGAAVVEAR
ncbi:MULTISPECIES: beta-ketoacyl synthase N-terminal-like domain-containing protein [unclassified Mesorhizobium]|uniref:beta-ketoacyl synthase N-terminal-like domain-containing protein n=1 Tax=unclassified Mesorhizobium TaxID=325217 RepID=UPI000FD1EA41|nr:MULTISPECIES: beta-ketoacyl synthase N-terminal-like domain-containing protein [unclassified Mesorhizobium]RVB77982.1 3-oxoacyl-ACP synthase [Mesorhizobium sp. M6A.T.Cr.TU.014.01.1.1]RWQ07961.1 MAG: 3-oxoacyl-ACP synthase [Mesorhizobium sp.]RWQ09015.1 MAG: 3-oxoacyl-ACP synthase [Mesorhizobium sp.]